MRGKEGEASERSKRKASSSPTSSLRQRLAARAQAKLPELQQKLFFESTTATADEGPGGRSEPLPTPCRQTSCQEAGPLARETLGPGDLHSSRDSRDSRDSPGEEAAPQEAARRMEALEEVQRLLLLRRRRFASASERARAVLGLEGQDGKAQQAFRNLMRKLHPDRIGAVEGAAEAMEMLQEARQQLQQVQQASTVLTPPCAPTELAAAVLVAQPPGQRRFRLTWQVASAVPVRRIRVAAVDPAYGTLTLRQLEPEYDETLRRFRTVEELTSYDLVEEELSKLPGFFQQTIAVVRVCAENEAGQSPWSSLSLRLAGLSTPRLQERKRPAPASREGKDFEQKLQSFLSGDGALILWLRKQSKALLSAWLRSQGWPITGSKDELVDRVAFAVGSTRSRSR